MAHVWIVEWLCPQAFGPRTWVLVGAYRNKRSAEYEMHRSNLPGCRVRMTKYVKA